MILLLVILEFIKPIYSVYQKDNMMPQHPFENTTHIFSEKTLKEFITQIVRSKPFWIGSYITQHKVLSDLHLLLLF